MYASHSENIGSGEDNRPSGRISGRSRLPVANRRLCGGLLVRLVGAKEDAESRSVPRRMGARGANWLPNSAIR
jgi:hypothetical protein